MKLFTFALLLGIVVMVNCGPPPPPIRQSRQSRTSGKKSSTTRKVPQSSPSLQTSGLRGGTLPDQPNSALLEAEYLLIALTIKDLVITDPLPDGIVREFIDYVTYMPLVINEMRSLALSVVKLDFKLNKMVEMALTFLKDEITTIPNLSKAISRSTSNPDSNAENLVNVTDDLIGKVKTCWDDLFKKETGGVCKNLDELAAQIKTTAMIPLGRYEEKQMWKSSFYKSRINSLTDGLNLAIKKVNGRGAAQYKEFEKCVKGAMDVVKTEAGKIKTSSR